MVSGRPLTGSRAGTSRRCGLEPRPAAQRPPPFLPNPSGIATVPRTTRLREAPAYGRTLWEHLRPDHPAWDAYERLTRRILNGQQQTASA